MVEFGEETGVNVREDREGHRPLVGYLIILYTSHSGLYYLKP